MFCTKLDFGSPLFDETIKLRSKILRVPLGLEFEPEEIAAEFEQFHFACYDASFQILGCFSLVKIGTSKVKMRQVAVDAPFQSKGIGTFMVQFFENWCLQNKINKISLHAREVAMPFYVKNGYKIKGDLFLEVGLPHYKMVKKLSK